jgi:hypothetical protein
MVWDETEWTLVGKIYNEPDEYNPDDAKTDIISRFKNAINEHILDNHIPFEFQIHFGAWKVSGDCAYKPHMSLDNIYVSGLSGKSPAENEPIRKTHYMGLYAEEACHTWDHFKYIVSKYGGHLSNVWELFQASKQKKYGTETEKGEAQTKIDAIKANMNSKDDGAWIKEMMTSIPPQVGESAMVMLRYLFCCGVLDDQYVFPKTMCYDGQLEDFISVERFKTLQFHIGSQTMIYPVMQAIDSDSPLCVTWQVSEEQLVDPDVLSVASEEELDTLRKIRGYPQYVQRPGTQYQITKDESGSGSEEEEEEEEATAPGAEEITPETPE